MVITERGFLVVTLQLWNAPAPPPPEVCLVLSFEVFNDVKTERHRQVLNNPS